MNPHVEAYLAAGNSRRAKIAGSYSPGKPSEAAAYARISAAPGWPIARRWRG